MPFIDYGRGDVEEIILAPLTREAMERNNRQIWGWIVAYSEEKGGPLKGLCLDPRRHDGHFTHPTLFSEFPVSKDTGPKVDIVLNTKDGKLHMYRCYDARWYRYDD